MGSQMAAMRLLVLALLMAIIHSLENVVPLTKITRSAADHLELVQVLSRVHAHLLLDLDGPAPILLHNHQNTQYVGAVKVGTPGQALMSIFDTGSGTFWSPLKTARQLAATSDHLSIMELPPRLLRILMVTSSPSSMAVDQSRAR